jgi:hypothetical protein
VKKNGPWRNAAAFSLLGALRLALARLYFSSVLARVFRGAWLREEAASVGGLFVVVLIGKNLLVEFKLFNQPLDFLHADIAGHDQPEAGILCGLFRPVPVTSPAPRDDWSGNGHAPKPLTLGKLLTLRIGWRPRSRVTEGY